MSGGRDYDSLIIIRVMGAEGSGKSSFILRATDNSYTDGRIQTIGARCKIANFSFDHIKIKFQIWDEERSSRYDSISRDSYGVRGVHIALVTVDVTDPAALDKTRKKILAERKLFSEVTDIILVATKVDGKREITSEQIAQFAEEMEIAAPVTEVSAKDNINIEATFHAVYTTDQRRNPEKYERSSYQAPAAKRMHDTLVIDPREQLKIALRNYIARINGYKTKGQAEPDFSTGFWFFAKSRALNRKVNYLLAKDLLSALNDDNITIKEVFDNIDQRKLAIINFNQINKNANFEDRGYRSTDLNTIIELARAFSSSPGTSSGTPLLRGKQ